MTCSNCGAPSRRSRCYACRIYHQRHQGQERPWSLIVRHNTRKFEQAEFRRRVLAR